MTKEFDDKARNTYNTMSLFFQEDSYTNGNVRDIIVERTTAKRVRPYVATHHYTKTLPDSTRFSFIAYLENTLAGVITYGMGVGKNQYLALIDDLKNGEYVELTRLWCPDEMPKNTESKIIAESLKQLPPEIRMVMSFSDSSRGHVGGIYQATNFYYCGKTSGGKMLITEDGIEKHPRLLGIYRMRHPEYKDYTNEELMKLLGFKYIEAFPKHRYVYLRGNKQQKRKMYNKIKDKILDYPKN